ncbi:MAG TPA: hypothetical protein VH278_00060 [Burkholderiaceae bacterium]|jgi:hypothetical protein|nr:hypothetical protein [Burkholderiaceae bacterium]
MPVLHQMQMSGNCYKIRLAARQLGVKLTRSERLSGRRRMAQAGCE